MALHCRQNLLHGGSIALLAFILFMVPVASRASDQNAFGFALRNQNPFLQVYGLPIYQNASLASHGKSTYNLVFDVANHADAGSNAVESVILDGESYFLTLSYRRGVADWLELGVDVPLVAHSDGVLDNFIEGWHDLFGISNSKRQGPSNQLQFAYVRDGATEYELNSGATGLGDIQLTAAMPIRTDLGGENLRLSLRGTVKLPTGDADTLLGSGAMDASLGIYLDDAYHFLQRPLRLSGFAGVLLLGDGDILPELQESTVPFAGAALSWQFSQQLDLVAQAYLQGQYLDSDLDEIGSNSVQITVGGEYHLSDKRTTLTLGLVEDLFSNTTPDFGLHFSVRVAGR